MALYNISEHVVLSPESCVAELILREGHEGPLYFSPNHRKAMDTLAKSRERCYIYRGYNLAKSVYDSCQACKVKAHKECSQKMGSVPPEVLIPAPAFTHVAADLMVPFQFKLKKVPKVWILIYQCKVSKALHLELVESYSGAWIC